MEVTNYTSYDEVRATCGLSSKELPDTELSLEIYGNVLSLALSKIELPDETPGPGPLSTRFIALKIIATADRTVLEQKLYDLTRIFCTYTIALEAVVSLSMKAPKTISDSKSTLTRFSPESVYKDVIERIESVLEDVTLGLGTIIDTVVDPLPLMGIAIPTTDVVTGETQ